MLLRLTGRLQTLLLTVVHRDGQAKRVGTIPQIVGRFIPLKDTFRKGRAWKSQIMPVFFLDSSLEAVSAAKQIVSKIALLSCRACGQSKGLRSNKKASARPCMPMPIGLCLRLEFLASSRGNGCLVIRGFVVLVSLSPCILIVYFLIVVCFY